MTEFVHTKVGVAPGVTLVIDGNSKVTAGNGTFSDPSPNAFSLPAASVSGWSNACPGSTPTCRASCYVRGLAANAPDVYSAYLSNHTALALILASDDDAPARRLGEWIAANASRGFRWHVSGDVQSLEHATWIARVCSYSPDVRHWIYTRTFGLPLAALLAAPNLAINLSADVDNYGVARFWADAYGLRLAYMATPDGPVPADLPADAIVFPDYPLRGRELADPRDAPWWQELPRTRRLQVCPADFFGQSEAHRCGPCDRCMRLGGAVARG